VGATERLTLPVPYGHRAYVVSDLDLGPESDPSSLPITEFVRLLNEIDDAAVVIIAGNLFRPAPTSDLARWMAATFTQLPAVVNALERFTSVEYRQVIVLPGRHDAELATHEAAHELLANMNITLASDVMLQVATARATQEIAVVPGTVTSDITAVSASEREDAACLEDPTALARFATSRLLYRRLSKWVWFPVWALVLFDMAGTLVAILGHLTHHHFHLQRTHVSDIYSVIFINLIILAAFEGLLALSAGITVRRRFLQQSPKRTSAPPAEPLAITHVHETDALQYARRVVDRGGLGAVIGGAPRPALAFMDRGVCATPGPSRTTVVERRGRFGLPPVFTAVERLGAVEIEAGTGVKVRLLAGEGPGRPATRLERWFGGAPRQSAPDDTVATLGSWPNGDPWPMAPDRLSEQRHRRTIRRIASVLLMLAGVADVIVAVAPAARGRLHSVLDVLPVGVVQSASALTGLAGVAMIMMARGVRRGQRRAWIVAVSMLAVTIVSHLARGGSVRGSLVAIIVLGVLVFQREHFTATTDRSSLRSALPRVFAIAVIAVTGAVIAVEFAALPHHETLPSLGLVILGCIERLVGITAIRFPDGVSDILNPTMLAIGVGLIVTLLYILTRPVVDRRLSEHATSTERRLAELRARDIVRRHGRGTLDYFALRDDKQFFFYRDSLVAYAVYGGVALLSPDPIGPLAERTEVFGEFRSYAESRGWTIGVVGASEDWLSIYQAAGCHHLYLGDEAVVDCTTFSLQGGKMKGLRQACTRMARHGYTVEFVDPATIDPAEVTKVVELIAKLRRGEGERGFSMMLGRLFNPKDQGLILTIVKDPEGNPAAVCQFLPSPAINGYSLDLMRRDPAEHPNGLLDYALCSTIEHLRGLGARGLSLNFAAFRSVLDGERGDGTFTRVERWALKRLSGVLPIETLWKFNAKYEPAWLPRYLCYPAAESFVPVVAAILRAESLTEIPVIGRLLANDPSNRPGTVVPDEILEQARDADRAVATEADVTF